MKTQMRFQKYICLAMIIVGALGLLYSFVYCTGSIADLGRNILTDGSTGTKTSSFVAAEGKYDAFMYDRIQPFNTAMMFCGIAMVLLAALLYVTSCNSRRNYYVTNYVAIGLCSIGNIVMSLVLIVYNAYWQGEFLNVDFTSWKAYCDKRLNSGISATDVFYGDSTLWFNIGYVVYAIIIVASIMLILNLVWKILLMRGEKQLLNGNAKIEEAAV